eukprot:TRINITY_DN7361_c0_g1_i2.p2 TRINITY_DN7361_c0_g1~~TRINITY_DN7361_c0_g1_i2.p2  ORF type:complete len:115 (-),score=11.19 TRINITY_DN7361_c0_g1_i2:223-567(-)
MFSWHTKQDLAQRPLMTRSLHFNAALALEQVMIPSAAEMVFVQYVFSAALLSEQGSTSVPHVMLQSVAEITSSQMLFVAHEASGWYSSKAAALSSPSPAIADHRQRTFAHIISH